MSNYLVKYKNLMHLSIHSRSEWGDKQLYKGESEGPSAGIQPLLMLLAIAIHNDLVIFKVDSGSAYMMTPITHNVKHKWVKLDKKVIELLLELKYDKFKIYIVPDGSLIVKRATVELRICQISTLLAWKSWRNSGIRRGVWTNYYACICIDWAQKQVVIVQPKHIEQIIEASVW